MAKYDIHTWMREHFLSDYPLRFLELGAHHGEDTATVLTHFPKAQAEIWECDPRCIAKLKSNKHDRRTDRFYAAGASCGAATFHQSSGYIIPGRIEDFSGSLLKPTRHLTLQPAVKFKPIEVEVRSLDSVYTDTSPAFDFVWADLQGGEAGMIAGGQKTLRRAAYVYMEAEDAPMYAGQAIDSELTALMADLGFLAMRRFTNNILYANQQSGNQ